MNDLSDAQKDIVTRAVRDYRGGLYLDVMNLSKRITLLYIKAFHAEMKKSTLTSEDRNKIIRDLAIASVIPMPVVDKKGNKILVFDEDIANEDHIYLFNREIKMYLLDAKDLRIDENGFDSVKHNIKSSHLDGVRKVAPAASPAQAKTCLSNAGVIENQSLRVSAQIACFDKYFQTFGTHQICVEIANSIENQSWRVSKQQSCFGKFN